MIKLDRIDVKLIKILMSDALQSSEVLAKQLDISPSAVRRRKGILVKNGFLKIQATPDFQKMGLNLAIVMALNVDHDQLDTVVNFLVSRPEVTWVSTTTGRFDVLAMMRFPSTEEFSRFVQNELLKIKGIRESETFICLNLAKNRSDIIK